MDGIGETSPGFASKPQVKPRLWLRESSFLQDPAMQHRVGFLVFPDFELLDLSGPLATFDAARRLATGDPYSTSVVSPKGGSVASSCGLEVDTKAIGDLAFDTFIVVGGSACRTPSAAADLAGIVRMQAGRARRLGSVCTGAFVLAAAGLLDGRKAITHWRHAAALQRLFPSVRVEAEPLFIADGPIWSSAGSKAAIDLALAMIEQDLGFETSKLTAQHMMVLRRRPGGQSHFAGLLDLEPETARMKRVLEYVRRNLASRLSVETLADVACLSPRQFGRAFAAELGVPPAKVVERLRVELARVRIEGGREPIERIADEVGFADPERMRQAFLRQFGQPPQAIRRAARIAA